MKEETKQEWFEFFQMIVWIFAIALSVGVLFSLFDCN